jgi:hypothetical protein
MMIQTTATAHDYKYLHVHGTRQALLVTFVNAMIFESDLVQGIERELQVAAELAARIDMPLVLSFRGVDDVSSELIEKVGVLGLALKNSGINLQIANLSPAVEAKFVKHL